MPLGVAEIAGRHDGFRHGTGALQAEKQRGGGDATTPGGGGAPHRSTPVGTSTVRQVVGVAQEEVEEKEARPETHVARGHDGENAARKKREYMPEMRWHVCGRRFFEQ